jgi:hypothetical protein
MTRLKMPAGLSGPSGLVSAIVGQAAKDASGAGGAANCIDALAYFGGPAYQDHLAWLGLPNDIRPAAFEQESTLIHVIDLVLREGHEHEPGPKGA